MPGGAAGPLFHNAVTWNSGVFQLAATTGPLLAGALIAMTKTAWPVYVIAAATCLWFAVTATFIRPHDDDVEAPRAGEPAASRKKPWHRIWSVVRPSVLMPGMLEGVRHIRRERTVFGAIALDLFAVLLGGATALMPVFASDILHVGPLGLGALRAAPFVGALAMAIVLAHRPPFRRAGPALLWSIAGFGACTVVFGLSARLALLAAGDARRYWTTSAS
ncbi:MAG: MFS transporter [Phycisphaerales bacterium]